MTWIWVHELLTEDMQDACTCMHLHAPNMQVHAPSMHSGEASGTPEDALEKEKGFSPTTPLPKSRSRSNHSLTPKPKTYIYKTLQLKDLPSDTEWWAARQRQFPGVDLEEELSKAQDWPGAFKVKNAKLYFRHWLEKAKPTKVTFLAPPLDEQLARLKAR